MTFAAPRGVDGDGEGGGPAQTDGHPHQLAAATEREDLGDNDPGDRGHADVVEHNVAADPDRQQQPVPVSPVELWHPKCDRHHRGGHRREAGAADEQPAAAERLDKPSPNQQAEQRRRAQDECLRPLRDAPEPELLPAHLS